MAEGRHRLGWREAERGRGRGSKRRGRCSTVGVWKGLGAAGVGETALTVASVRRSDGTEREKDRRRNWSRGGQGDGGWGVDGYYQADGKESLDPPPFLPEHLGEWEGKLV